MSLHTTDKLAKTQALNVYIHLPFCAAKCRYCAFYSRVTSPVTYEKYLQALLKEIKERAPDLKQSEVCTVYLGGGTPSLISPDQIQLLLSTLRSNLKVASTAEITLEANPDSLNRKKLADFQALGITRLSLGLQAWQNHLLKYLGRRHTHQQFWRVYQQARQAGFTNINVDCIFGIPGQTLADWQATLEALIALNPEHLSCYSLELENNSAFGLLAQHGLLPAVAEEVDRGMYRLAKRLLARAGYAHYEISNFAKPGYQCRHNVDFWHSHPYIGFGAGAHSYLNQIHSSYQESLEAYIDQPLDQRFRVAYPESKQMHRLGWLMLRLRLINGFLVKEYVEEFHARPDRHLTAVLNELKKAELVCQHQHRFKLTAKGLDLYDLVISRISRVV